MLNSYRESFSEHNWLRAPLTPRLAGQPYQSSGGKMTYHPDLKREIPDGWSVGQISDLCRLNQSTWGTSNALLL